MTDTTTKTALRIGVQAVDFGMKYDRIAASEGVTVDFVRKCAAARRVERAAARKAGR